eukprot:184494_1
MLLLFNLLSITSLISARPSVGIIRWDAWNLVNGNYDEISYYVHRDMSPNHWHYRLPFYAEVLSPNDTNISFNNNQQSIIDQEIKYAKAAGIDYFAFDTYCAYGPNCATNETLCQIFCNTTSYDYCPEDPTYGLDLYLSSQYKELVNFTLVLLSSLVCIPSNVEVYVDLMKQKTFQTVLDNRPLIYLFGFTNDTANQCGGWDKSKAVFDNIRGTAISNGLQNPYFVLMDFHIPRGHETAIKLGFDAISTYALPGGTNPVGAPFSDQVNAIKIWWNQAASLNYTFVPLVSTGWDPRPRAENPPPWTHEGPDHYLQPTAEELQNFVRDCIDFTCKYGNNVTEAQTIIIYAWNECTENGACVIPTLGNGTLYVDALGKVLPSDC